MEGVARGLIQRLMSFRNAFVLCADLFCFCLCALDVILCSRFTAW